MAKKAARPGTSLNTEPRHVGVTMRRQAEMEAKAAEGPAENKSAKTTRAAKKTAKPAAKKTAKKSKKR